MKFIFTFIICWLSFCANAQEGQLLLEVKGLPIRDGKVYAFVPRRTACCMTFQDGVEIISKTDSVFSNINGTISFAGKIADEFAVIIKISSSVFITFSRLESIVVNKGDKINKGSFIGRIKLDDNNSLTLGFIVCNNRGEIFNEKRSINFLKKNISLPCISVDQPIVAR